jgi:hypothetical protein
MTVGHYQNHFCSKCGKPGKFSDRISVNTGLRSVRGVCDACRLKQQQKRRKANLAEYRRRDREQMRKTRESGYYKQNPDQKQGTKEYGRRRPERYLWDRIKSRAGIRRCRGKTRGIRRYAVRLTFEEFVREIGGSVPKVCPVLGIKMRLANSRIRDRIPTIDRMDSSKPYEIGNISVMSWRANLIKSIGTAAEHRKIADWMDKMAARKR